MHGPPEQANLSQTDAGNALNDGLPVPRKAIRIALDAEVGIRRASEKLRAAQLRDLSTHGCSVELLARVNLNEIVWVKLPGIEALQGFVCWVDEYICGIEFDSPLHPAVTDMLAKRLGG